MFFNKQDFSWFLRACQSPVGADSINVLLKSAFAERLSLFLVGSLL
jgi:hypothetical protein